MRRSLLVLMILPLSLMMSATAWAEDTTAALSGFGLKAGAGSSTGQFANDALTTSSGIGFGAGLQGVISINDYFAIAPELLFTMRTAAIDLPTGAEDARTNTHFGLQIPLALVLRIPILRSVTPRLSAGLYGSYTLFGNATDRIGSISNTVEYRPGDFNPLGFGLIGGLGFDIKLGERTLTLDGRIEQGLTNRNGAEDAMAGYQFQAIQVLIGFIL